MNEHDEMRLSINQIRYPAGIVGCPGEYCAIQGQSFFAGGRGHTGKNLPYGGAMYLGHYFDKIDGFTQSVNRGREENLTWRKIREAVLNHLPEDRVWFTNYFMGVSLGSSNNGPLERTPGFSTYEEDCWNFLNLQVALQRPSVIVALGKEVVCALGVPNRLNIPSWVISKNVPFGSLRLTPHPVTFRHDGREVQTRIIAAYHPSYGRAKAQIAAIEEDSMFVASKLLRSSHN